MSQIKYKADLRDFKFLMFEQFAMGNILSKEPFVDWSEQEINMVLGEAYRFATEVLSPINSSGDREHARLENGQVKVPKGFKEAWKKLYETGFRQLSSSAEFGGQGAPRTLAAVAEELFCGANCAFMMYPGLSLGAAELIDHCGNQEQKNLFCTNMYNGKWSGTMCLTEPQAGSDVGASSTTASKNADGTFSIKGTKIFISGGDQDITENVIHLVLARIDGAEAGTKGLSLFIVPKMKVDSKGTILGSNDVKVPSIEHKMGINGSATCVVQFGDDSNCTGYLVGGVEHQGMRQMFQMMNYARIGVGIQGLGVAGAAYQAALDYARERKQGPHSSQWKDPSAPKVAIIEHPDVRRMLLEMKAKVDGIRALMVKLSMHQDMETVLRGKDDAGAAYHDGQIDILTPVFKSYGSDQAFKVAELAIQVHGGYGYISEYGVEQHLRDSKIFSIYEGTNHIQALDLVGRKLGLAGGKYAQELFGDIQKFVTKNLTHPVLGAQVATLGKATEAVGGSAMQLLGWSQAGQAIKVPLHANRFLEMVAELVVSWLLLEGAVIALEKQTNLTKDHSDFYFYEGKKHSAVYYANVFLPEVIAKSKVMQTEASTPLDIPTQSFSTV